MIAGDNPVTRGNLLIVGDEFRLDHVAHSGMRRSVQRELVLEAPGEY